MAERVLFPASAPIAWHREWTDQDLPPREAHNVQLWQEITGHNPKESTFTLVLPIHNEAKHLTSVLDALLLSGIPTSARLHLLAITNACSDESPHIAQQYFTAKAQL